MHPSGDEIAAGDIARDTLPRPVHGVDGRFEAVIPDAWRVFYAFGGVTMALALRAAEAALERPDLRLVSAHATYCQAVPCGPVAVQVEVIRSGRKGAQVEARLWVTDRPAGESGADLVLLVVFGADRPESPYRLLGATFPEDAPGPQESAPRVEADPTSPFARIPYHRQTDWRQAIGRAPWDAALEPGSEPRTVSWFRFLEPPVRPDGTWEPATLAVPGDILGPAVVEGVGRRDGFFLVITLQLSLQFFAPMRGDWLCQHTRALHAGEGFSTGVAELWSEDRALVAVATQAAMLQAVAQG